MIPNSQLNPGAVAGLMDYLRREIFQAQGDRRLLEERWIKYQIAYRIVPEKERKDFPFQGSANLVIPVIATDVDIVFSRLMGILFNPDNLWSCKPLNETMVDFAPRLQEFLEWAQEAELGAYDAVADWLMELCKLGTGILKQRYTRESKRVYLWRETSEGVVEQQTEMLVKDHPVIEHVSLFDFLIPGTSKNIQDAPWCAERITLTWGQILNRMRAGIYQVPPNFNRSWLTDRGSMMEQQMGNLDLLRPTLGDRIELWECWLDYDIQGIGQPQAIVATVHVPSQTFFRIDYNPFFTQEKPYSFARYLRQEKRFYGIGLCEMLDQFQDEISTMHNQRLDNSTLSNSSMFKAKRGAGIRQDEPVFPGRWFLLDDLDDVVPMNMGQRYDSTINNEQLTLNYARGRTGVSDYISGADNTSINYATATTVVQQQNQGAKRFDQVLRESRRCLGETGRRVVELYQQFNQHGKEYLAMGPRDGEFVRQILQFPMELIRNAVSIELTATNAALNKEAEIRTNTVIMQMLSQFYQQLMQGMSYLVNPQMPVEIRHLAGQMINGGTILMKRILDSYGIQDAASLVPELQDALVLGQQRLSALYGAYTGNENGNAGFVPQPSMAGLPGGSSGVAPNGLQQPQISGGNATLQIPGTGNGLRAGVGPAGNYSPAFP